MSKLGIHVSAGNRTGFGDFLKRCAEAGSPVPVIFAVDQNVWPDVQQFSPDTIVIFRHQPRDADGSGLDAPGGMYHTDPIQTAQNWMNRIMPKWRQNPAHYYAPINEQDAAILDHYAWLDAFTLECLRVADANGFKLALYAFSSGNPRDDVVGSDGQPIPGGSTLEQKWGKMLPSMQYAKANGHILLLHEYGFNSPARNGGPATSLRASAPNLALRYRRSYRYLHQFNADPPLVISEASAGAGGFAGIGLDAWLADVKWYDSELMRDKAVLGCCLYQVGGAENIREVLPALGAYIAATPTRAPEGDPVIGIGTPAQPSPDGTVVPPAESIIDAELRRWSLGEPAPHGLEILRDGAQFAGGQGTLLLYFDRKIYTVNDLNHWWMTSGSGWQRASGDPRPSVTEPFWCSWPIQSTEAPRITDKFNAPRDYANRKHEGIDGDAYINATGQLATIVAAQDGVVETVRNRTDSPSYGIHVVIRHPWGNESQRYRTLYAHLSRVIVPEGAQVKRGEPIGVAGRSGTTAIHLHFGVYDAVDGLAGYVRCRDCSATWSGGPIDPERVLRIESPSTPPATLAFKAGVGVGNPQLLTARELEALRISRVGAVKLLTLANSYEMSRTIEDVRRVRPDMFIVARLFYAADANHVHRFSPLEFINTVTPGLSAAYAAGVRYFEVHNEPNLESEGYGWNWANGREFNAWLLETLRILRARYPDAKWGYPGLSPQPNTLAFIDASREAVMACDWLAAHAYWQTAIDSGWGMYSLDGGLYWQRLRTIFPNRPMMITEFSNNAAGVPGVIKAQQYADYYRACANSNVMAAFAFALSWPGQDANREAWVTGNVITDIPITLGSVL